ncbi:MAG: diaminopimelate decarboxylase [Cyclobacteriaceae bacterium]
MGAFDIQGISPADLISRFGSPLYIYDASIIERQIRRLQQAFRGTPTRIKYAAKALTTLGVLQVVRQCGAGVDVVSVNEAKLAMRAGYQPSDIMFTSSGVVFDEIVEAVSLGIQINVDNLSALDKFGRAFGSEHPCCVRLNPHIMAGGNLKISTGHKHSKFGISVEQVDRIVAVVKQHHIRINGLHIHTGSEISDANVFLQMGDVFFGLAQQFPDLDFIDFGGGFKVPYKPGDVETDLNEVGSRMSEAFNAFCTRYGRQLELWIEPGKFIVSEAGKLLTTVTVVKESPALTFAGVDSGLNHLIRPMMYDAYHEITNVSNVNGPVRKYNVVGNMCETDTFGADRMLQEVSEGDILMIHNAGAYGFSMSSQYNSRFRPAEVLIRNGQAHLIRQRESFDDLLRGQIVLAN